MTVLGEKREGGGAERGDKSEGKSMGGPEVMGRTKRAAEGGEIKGQKLGGGGEGFRVIEGRWKDNRRGERGTEGFRSLAC